MPATFGGMIVVRLTTISPDLAAPGQPSTGTGAASATTGAASAEAGTGAEQAAAGRPPA